MAVVLGLVVLVSAMDVGASAEIVTGPLLLIGLGMGGLASQLGSVTVSAVPDEQSPEVGGLQNTATQFGASLGTAPGRLGPDRRPDRLVPDRDRRRTRRCPRRSPSRRPCSSRPACPSSPTPSSRRRCRSGVDPATAEAVLEA